MNENRLNSDIHFKPCFKHNCMAFVNNTTALVFFFFRHFQMFVCVTPEHQNPCHFPVSLSFKMIRNADMSQDDINLSSNAAL